MRKVVIACECGQRLQVPYSALGKVGLCPNCGRKVLISAENARWEHADGQEEIRPPASENHLPLPQEMKNMFGRAVDLFNTGHFAEALAIFDTFEQHFPGNPEIQEARTRCLNALRKARTPRPEPLPHLSAADALDAETVKRVVLEKLLYGPTASVQLEAADIACRILGMYSKEPPAPKPEAGALHEPQEDGGVSAEGV